MTSVQAPKLPIPRLRLAFFGFLALLLSYATFPTVVLPAVILLAFGLHARRWSGRFALVIALLGPYTMVPAASFWQGWIGHARGTATRLYVGLPGPESGNIDPETRTYGESTG